MDTARALTDKLVALLRRENHARAEFLVALAAFDHDRLWVELGYRSLFDFLHREFRLSRSAAHYRKVAARLIQQVPAVVEPLRQGLLCMTSIVEAARVRALDRRQRQDPLQVAQSRGGAPRARRPVHGQVHEEPPRAARGAAPDL